MSDTVLVLKDENNQTAVPYIWRNTFCDIVEALKKQDFKIERIPGVRPLSAKDVVRIAGNIQSYGAHLATLPDETWQTSVCQWMRGHWAVLIDLFTIEEGASDLVLAARIYEDGSGYIFDVESVHVP